MKSILRRLFFGFSRIFSRKILDVRSGRHLGRGFILPHRGGAVVAGYEGIPLVPVFKPQKKLIFWRQTVGFSSHMPPDFRHIAADSGYDQQWEGKVLNLVISHLAESLDAIRKTWEGVCPEENLWILFGGDRDEFEKMEYPRKIFVDDEGLRTVDHQREKQSYAVLMHCAAEVVRRERPAFVYLCEYDHVPVVPNLNELQVATIMEQNADVMCHHLIRADGTNFSIALTHDSDPGFRGVWESLSLREDKTLVLWMFGSGSFWTSRAFLAVAEKEIPIRCYFEIHLPTMAHHLGFRVRGWEETNHLVGNLPTPLHNVANARRMGCWTVHPVKSDR
jgi:hypothetical protein